jgi:hypothetical protein
MPWEAEEVALNGPVWRRNKDGKTAEWKAVGYTDAGRILALFVKVNAHERTLKVITGYPAHPNDIRRHLRR